MISEKPIKILKRCYTGIVTKDKKYYIGTSTSSVYIYDYETTELVKRFNDVRYQDKLYLNEDNTLLVVKSTNPQIAVYDLNTLTLKHKIYVKGTSQPQGSNLCFSHCGNYLYNIVYDNDLLSFILKIDLKDGSYKKINIPPFCVFTQILYVKEHKQYYLFGYERTSKYKSTDFIRCYNQDFEELKYIEMPNSYSQVVYSPKEDLFYTRSISGYAVQVFRKNFKEVVKVYSSETKIKVIKGNHSQREETHSIYSYSSGFSLNKNTLNIGIAYAEAIVIMNNDAKELGVYPMSLGTVNLSNIDDELFLNGKIYKIT